MEKKNVSFEEIDAVVTNESLNVEKEDEANSRNDDDISMPSDDINFFCRC